MNTGSKVLLAHGARVGMSSVSSRLGTPLHCVLGSSPVSLPMVSLLFAHGARDSILLKGFKGNTPLHLAVEEGSSEVVDFLLKSCADQSVSSQNDSGLTPLAALRKNAKPGAR